MNALNWITGCQCGSVPHLTHNWLSKGKEMAARRHNQSSRHNNPTLTWCQLYDFRWAGDQSLHSRWPWNHNLRIPHCLSTFCRRRSAGDLCFALWTSSLRWNSVECFDSSYRYALKQQQKSTTLYPKTTSAMCSKQLFSNINHRKGLSR